MRILRTNNVKETFPDPDRYDRKSGRRAGYVRETHGYVKISKGSLLPEGYRLFFKIDGYRSAPFRQNGRKRYETVNIRLYKRGHDKMLQIDRKRVGKVFADYVENYNSRDDKVRLKIEHTYRVAELCERIAKSMECSKEETDFAWLTGILHDVGRFEQLRNFGTFNDAQSIDHAAYGADILFQEGKIRDYIGEQDDKKQEQLVENVVRYHSAYRLPEEFDGITRKFCNILRDADKVDILKVNVDFPLEEIYNVTTQELRNSEVTEAVMESLKEEHATLRSLKRTAVDNVVGHISLVFELVYPESLNVVKEQGYLEKLLSFESQNQKTKEQFREVRKVMEEYLRKR